MAKSQWPVEMDKLSSSVCWPLIVGTCCRTRKEFDGPDDVFSLISHVLVVYPLCYKYIGCDLTTSVKYENIFISP